MTTEAQPAIDEIAIDDPAPTAAKRRVASLDVLRGFALCGILVMNVQSFSMVSAAYLNPRAFGDFTGANYAVWLASHVLAEQKFLSLFSLLFGAGVVMLAERCDDRGQSAARLHYRRLAWLLVFGLVHAYVLWPGDILVHYAMTGAIVFWFRRQSPPRLIGLAAVLLAIGSAFYVLTGVALSLAGEAELAEFQAEWAPDGEAVAEELAIYRGGWLGQMPDRAIEASVSQTFYFAFYAAWQIAALMLIGMALEKLRVLDASRPPRFYLALAGIGLAIGLPLILFGVQQRDAYDWDVAYLLFLGGQYNYWGSLLVTLAYVGLIMLACQAGWLRWLAPMGQMALTNYLGQSVTCVLIFYGYGLGCYGYLSRVQQLVVVAVILATQVAVSNVWLRRYRYGPMEWLWRSLTYLKWQPIRREVAA